VISLPDIVARQENKPSKSFEKALLFFPIREIFS